MNFRLPTLDLFWSQTWEAFGPYLLPTLIAGALFVTLLLLGRRGEHDAKVQRELRRPGAAPTSSPATLPAAPLAVSAAETAAEKSARQALANAAATSAATAAATSAANLPAAPAATIAPPALLVVDDSAVVRAKLRKLLEGAGYRVVLANDGHQALAALPNDFFSVLITDLEMPNMGGVELIASVQGSLETEDLPIIAITGHDELQAHVRDCQGLYGIFRKPWNDRELLRRVEALAGLRVQRSAATA